MLAGSAVYVTVHRNRNDCTTEHGGGHVHDQPITSFRLSKLLNAGAIVLRCLTMLPQSQFHSLPPAGTTLANVCSPLTPPPYNCPSQREGQPPRHGLVPWYGHLCEQHQPPAPPRRRGRGTANGRGEGEGKRGRGAIPEQRRVRPEGHVRPSGLDRGAGAVVGGARCGLGRAHRQPAAESARHKDNAHAYASTH